MPRRFCFTEHSKITEAPPASSQQRFRMIRGKMNEQFLNVLSFTFIIIITYAHKVK